ncbi:AraC-type DNA-binding protein [Palleronia marisminoris]|uniref:Regulatory protein PchR n=1 Tax=Palleronia marisminoris TaxID=315423 RepID=A0A1Y5TTX9_9RHOB|nr:AraC family transcriptional regulator [Palleronia marisminoris]SFH48964.1 AraC-type DNA-binding protein [Palleronia marisminoris]SLN69611.1 Regulatory protein PchR [Palleronia marisminoris]
MTLDPAVTQTPPEVGSGFTRVPKLVRIGNPSVLEGGTYWPELCPYFSNPAYRRLRYNILEGAPASVDGAHLSLRGAARVDSLDLAFIADRYAAALSIAGNGLPDYCLTLVRKGGLVCTGLPGADDLRVGPDTGLIYRGQPGTTLTASGSHERFAIWIPAAMLRTRLSALLGEPVLDDIEFVPLFEWDAPATKSLRGLVSMLVDEFCEARGVLSLEVAARSFVDLFLYTLLRSVPHRHSHLLDRPASPVLPATVRRAEAYIAAHLEDPIALHEVAVAAGCSVRSLQAAFQRFREATPLQVIHAARLRAARAALLDALPGTTVTTVAMRYGFTNPGRFAGRFKRTYGVSPAELLRRGDM